MSYEGYKEYICSVGHLVAVDCHEEAQHSCPMCGEIFTHSKSVDMTNGFEASNPSSHQGAKEVIGAEEVVTERLLYRPVGTLWTKINTHTEERSK